MPPELSNFLVAVVRGLFWAALAAVAAVFLTHLAPSLLETLRGAREDLSRFSGRTMNLIEAICGARYRRLIERRRSEHLEPAAVQLERIADELPGVGTRQIRRLVMLERQIAGHRNAISAIGPEAFEAASSRGSLGSQQHTGASVWSVLFGVLIAVAVGLVNSFLLNVFFRETIGSNRLLPYPLPSIQASHVISSLMFLVEIAVGWQIYKNTKNGSNRELIAFFPWLMLGGLALIEIVAYGVLSVRVNAPARLGIDPASPFFGIAMYFLSVFGACLTGMLAYMGHSVAESADGFAESRSRRSHARALRRTQQEQKSPEERAARILSAAEELKLASESLPSDLTRAFQTFVQGGQPEELAARLRTRVSEILSTNGSAARRSLGEVLRELALGAVVVSVMCAVILGTYYATLTYLLLFSRIPVIAGHALALAAAAACVGAGFVSTYALPLRRPVAVPTPYLNTRRSRRFVFAASAVLFVGTLMTLTLVFVRVRAGGGNAFTAAGLAFVTAAVGAFSGAYLASALSAATDISYCLAVGVVALGLFLAAAAGNLGNYLLWVVEKLLRILAAPGAVLIRWWFKGPVGALAG